MIICSQVKVNFLLPLLKEMNVHGVLGKKWYVFLIIETILIKTILDFDSIFRKKFKFNGCFFFSGIEMRFTGKKKALKH